MRLALFALSALLVISLVPQPAAAAGGCSGGWMAPGNACTFTCDLPTLNVLGNAGGVPPGAIAWLRVTADCGYYDLSGNFVVVSSTTCTSWAPVSTACGQSTLSVYNALQLTGRCTVTGMMVGSYSCWTSL